MDSKESKNNNEKKKTKKKRKKNENRQQKTGKQNHDNRNTSCVNITGAVLFRLAMEREEIYCRETHKLQRDGKQTQEETHGGISVSHTPRRHLEENYK